MNEVTRILSDLAQGHAHAAEQLLPLVYDELRLLAAALSGSPCRSPTGSLSPTPIRC